MQMSGYGGKREKLKWREWVKSKEACQNDRQTVNMKIERRRVVTEMMSECLWKEPVILYLKHINTHTHEAPILIHSHIFTGLIGSKLGDQKRILVFSRTYSYKNPKKKYIIVSTKVLSSKTVNIDNNNNCFLSTKSAYQFLKTLKAGVMAAENSALPSQE